MMWAQQISNYCSGTVMVRTPLLLTTSALSAAAHSGYLDRFLTKILVLSAIEMWMLSGWYDTSRVANSPQAISAVIWNRLSPPSAFRCRRATQLNSGCPGIAITPLN